MMGNPEVNKVVYLADSDPDTSVDLSYEEKKKDNQPYIIVDRMTTDSHQ